MQVNGCLGSLLPDHALMGLPPPSTCSAAEAVPAHAVEKGNGTTNPILANVPNKVGMPWEGAGCWPEHVEP